MRRTNRLLNFSFLLVAILGARGALAVEVSGLNQADAIVTGTGEAERLRGFKLGLEEVLIKRTGDAALVHTEKVAPLMNRAAEFVERYEYEDRKKGKQISDEQGTRDRSFFLRMTFTPAKLDAELRALGVAPWSGARPTIVVCLGIKDSVRSYVLGAETPLGAEQREALMSVAGKHGVPVVLPAMDMEDRARIGYDNIADGEVERLRRFSKRYGGDALLFGTLVMDAQGYWTLSWSLDWNDKLDRDRLDGVTFDVALRTAIERSAKRLADASH